MDNNCSLPLILSKIFHGIRDSGMYCCYRVFCCGPLREELYPGGGGLLLVSLTDKKNGWLFFTIIIICQSSAFAVYDGYRRFWTTTRTLLTIVPIGIYILYIDSYVLKTNEKFKQYLYYLDYFVHDRAVGICYRFIFLDRAGKRCWIRDIVVNHKLTLIGSKQIYPVYFMVQYFIIFLQYRLLNKRKSLLRFSWLSFKV